MKRTLTATRIFPLGSYQNLSLTAGVEFTSEEWAETRQRLVDDEGIETESDAVQEIYDGLINDIYTQAIRHQQKLDASQAAETIAEKQKVFGG